MKMPEIYNNGLCKSAISLEWNEWEKVSDLAILCKYPNLCDNPFYCIIISMHCLCLFF
uniref:Uncharacterized protein n=1 Tax=Anguilla anguilla TaxID=7936 RepID=A0A0E9TR47_ANGAN